MKKKVGILTQPLHDNYGGLLQAFALKTTLESIGLNVEIINRRKPYTSLKYKLARFISKLKGKKVAYQPTAEQKKMISTNTNYFTQKYITHITKPIFSDGELRKYKNNYDIIVVGSDQVWKPSYSPNIANYYLDFIDNPQVIGLAYAASFGGNTWDYSVLETEKCKNNINKFKAISVREDSGIDLVKNNLNAEAVHVLDPTFLVERDTYINLIKNENENPIEDNTLITYVLDKNPEKKKLIEKVASTLNLTAKSINVKEKATENNLKNKPDDCIYPTVTSWLNGFYGGDFIITDSFHGTVFSIIFNKPFIVLANPGRGNARFLSLLKDFGLESRLVLKPDEVDINQLVNLSPIDWDFVNNRINERKLFSFQFLTDNIN